MEHQGFGKGRGTGDYDLVDAVGDDKRAGRKQEEWLGAPRHFIELGDELGYDLCEGRSGRKGQDMGKAIWSVRNEGLIAVFDRGEKMRDFAREIPSSMYK